MLIAVAVDPKVDVAGLQHTCRGSAVWAHKQEQHTWVSMSVGWGSGKEGEYIPAPIKKGEPRAANPQGWQKVCRKGTHPGEPSGPLGSP